MCLKCFCMIIRLVFFLNNQVLYYNGQQRRDVGTVKDPENQSVVNNMFYFLFYGSSRKFTSGTAAKQQRSQLKKSPMAEAAFLFTFHLL